MTKKDIDITIRQGEIVVTTKELIREAVIESIHFLYDDICIYDKNYYMGMPPNMNKFQMTERMRLQMKYLTIYF